MQKLTEGTDTGRDRSDSSPAGAPSAPAATGFAQRASALIALERIAGAPDRADGSAADAFGAATAGAGGTVPYRGEMEHAFGHDFSGVQSHLGKQEQLEPMGAKAAAHGDTVAFASTSPSRETVAHELTHVVQARQSGGAGGGVRASSVVTAPTDAAEVEADRVAGDVVGGKPARVEAHIDGAALHRLMDAKALEAIGHRLGSGGSDHFNTLVGALDRYNNVLRLNDVAQSREGRELAADIFLKNLNAVTKAAEQYLAKTNKTDDNERVQAVKKLADDAEEESLLIDWIVDNVAFDHVTSCTWERAIQMQAHGVDPSPGLDGEKVTWTSQGKGEQPAKVDRGDRKEAKKNAKEGDIAQLVAGTGFDPDPDVAKKALGERCPGGPALSEQEYKGIRKLTDSGEKGVAWLHAVGMFTSDEARAYVEQGNFRDFHNLRKVQKMQLASIAYRIGKKGTPPYVMEISMRGEKDEVRQTTTDAWVETLKGGELNDQAVHAIAGGGVVDPETKKPNTVGQVQEKHGQALGILRKVFILLQAGLKKWDKGQEQYVDWEGPVATALSHGGRVNIRVPKLKEGDTSHAITDWLGITQQGKRKEGGAVFDRGFATHRIEIGEDKEDGTRGTFKEKGGMGASIANKLTGDTEILGMNIAVGGMGNKDFNGDVILPDGAHGHMFIGFRPPTDKLDGALQIGIETTGPGAPSTVGYEHTWRSSEKTANPISSVGGLKKDKVGSTDDPNMIDLAQLGAENDGDWKGKLDEFAQLFEHATPEQLVGERQQQG